MEYMNIKAILLAAVANLVVGFLWYNPKTFGNIWMKQTGLKEEDLKNVNMPLLYGSAFVLAMLISVALHPVVIHQMHLGSLCMHQMQSTDPVIKENAIADIAAFKSKYGSEFLSFKHGAIHGLLTAVFLIFPIIAVNGLFERKSWKYILINAGFWAVSLCVMGSIICGMSA